MSQPQASRVAKALSPEDRKKADQIRLDRLQKANASHEASMRREELSEMRRLESSKKRDWSDEGFLYALKKKYGQ
jgi:hypothetical protein